MPRKRKETRAMFYSVKATPLARAAQKSLARIKVKLDKMQLPWGEADPLIESATARAVEALEELRVQYAESAKYLNEPMED